ncbi:MAG TPA: pimeloyl-ACP methyl esterase BioG family protein [Bacteroidales bacterium]|nr:pimeloyl-ACP methyl esterase BioG family protein [Bacteroidales bacterium]
MKTYIKRREKNTHLVVFFGGWGTDENMFTPLCSDDFDFIMFYNYSADEALVLPETKTYERITLIGWSLGVWAAEFFASKTKIIPDISIAVNGTPLPADNQYGIPISVFEGTMNNITEENMDKFYLRVFGDKKAYLINSKRVPKRTIKSLQDELRWLYNRIMEQNESDFKWTYAVTGKEDRVFPSENLISYWEKITETRHIVVSMPHYFFHNWNSFTGFIKFVENYVPGKPNKSERKTKDF